MPQSRGGSESWGALGPVVWSFSKRLEQDLREGGACWAIQLVTRRNEESGQEVSLLFVLCLSGG